jgi:hypothetical protein
MAESEKPTDRGSREVVDRNVLNRILYKEETSFMEEYYKELDDRLDELEDNLEARGSVVKPVTPFGMVSMLVLLVGFGILALISWYSGPIG